MEIEINPQFKVIVIIAIILFILSGIPFKFIKNTLYPPKEIVNTTPINNTVVVYQTVTVLVTPTPDGIRYYANEYQTGIRKLNKTFTFVREDVSGLKDLSVHAKVYDYRILPYYTWFNPSDYKYYQQHPIDSNNDYLFIFVQIYMDDITGDDARLWLPNANLYGVQINGLVYSPIEFEKQLRIKELEETSNYNNDYRIGYYGTNKYHDYNHPETAGETYEELTYLRGGLSNAIDGYIIYEIPKDTKPEDITVLVNYYAFGNVGWRLIH